MDIQGIQEILLSFFKEYLAYVHKSVANGRTENGQQIGATVQSHCVDNFE